ncbi:Response regulator PleD [Rubripirellula lacrimiformis]|uniref:diguanylate cyclase n=1 Tax=Rubripirellula lacrimiformis TaxID=1930273 RepID=A0A517NEA1_9BACT|nr:diguanylate cyclase [Rubripirellula lacrimiformis]QDT05451.1 Response regulator PleD [Rubripirellula lacrimiformis]
MLGISPKAISVLLVEDQESEAFMVTRILTRTSQAVFEVEHASSLQEAIQQLSENDFDVCLLDLGLPDGHGIESLHQIRCVDARLPVVVLTGNDNETLGLAAIEKGAQDYVAKGAISGQLLTRSLSFAIARQQKMLGIAADANTDILTGMPNRRRLSASFSELVEHCKVMCIALLDIDHFKRVNDLHGHLVGDHVLRHIAKLISESSQHGIQAARYGGEEFAILLPEAGLENAIHHATELIRSIESSQIELRDVCLKVTASVGITSVIDGDQLEDALRRSDVALYDAKRSGRNQVCVKI